MRPWAAKAGDYPRFAGALSTLDAPRGSARGALAGAAGFVVGMASLRVRHDFLAITTMGVTFLFVGIVHKQEALGGEVGISGIPSVAFERPGLLALALVCTILFVLLAVRIRRSWMGFAYESVADDEDTARVLGIDVPPHVAEQSP